MPLEAGVLTGAPLSLSGSAQFTLADADGPVPGSGFFLITPTVLRTLSLPSSDSVPAGTRIQIRNLAPATAADVTSAQGFNDAPPLAPISIPAGESRSFVAGNGTWYSLGV
jgi:hypothetical protein